jgi:hypothetical protein
MIDQGNVEQQWDLHSLHQLINNKVEESLTLEYKASEALNSSHDKKKEITKDVSAMANSAGGVLFYGIKEYKGKDKRVFPEKLDPVNRVTYSLEWLQQVINNIQPRIHGLVITPVYLDSDNIQAVYVLEIPESNTAHQALDKKYYRRFNSLAEAMYDHEIRMVMNRGILTDAIVDIKSLNSNENFYKLTITIENVGKKVINHFKIEVILPSCICNQRIDFIRLDGWDASGDSSGDLKIIKRSRTILHPNDKIDVFQHTVWTYSLNDNVIANIYQSIHEERDLSVEWNLYADDMPKKSGRITLRELHGLN